MRAESALARDMPTAPITPSGGIVSPMSAWRITRSFGRTMPVRAATMNTQRGVSIPVSPSTITTAASAAQIARITHSRVRPPSRSPSTPNIGAASVPSSCNEPNVVSSRTEPVCTMTYQPRMSVSISNAQDIRRSAGH